MQRKLGSCFWIVLAVCCLGCVGCASYKPEKGTGPSTTASDLMRDEVVFENTSFSVHVVLLDTKKKANPYLGIDPPRCGMLPILVKVDNHGSRLIKMDVMQSCLTTDANEVCVAMDLLDAIRIAKRSGGEAFIGLVVFGMAGWAATAPNNVSVNRTLEEDYHSKYFDPTLLKEGASGCGVLFYQYPKKKFKSIVKCSLLFVDPVTKEKTTVDVPL